MEDESNNSTTWLKSKQKRHIINSDTDSENLYLTSQPTKSKIVSEYDQEIPQSQTADNPMAPQGRAAQPSRDTRKTN